MIIKNKPEKVLKHGWDGDTFNEMIGNEPLTLKLEPMPRDYTHSNENPMLAEVPDIFEIRVNQSSHSENNGNKKGE